MSVKNNPSPVVKSTEKQKKSITGATSSLLVGRGLPSLLPWDALREVSRILEQGAVVHDPRNWEKGLSEASYLDSVIRHVEGYMEGDSSEPHLSQIACRSMMWLSTRLRIEAGTLSQEFRDIPGVGHGILPPHPKS